MTTFGTSTYARDWLEGMTVLFNEETAFEKYIAPLDTDRFIELVENKSYFDPEGLFVAHEGGRVLGWIHACVAAGSEGHHDPEKPAARIRMLVFSRSEMKVGNVLVEEATRWLKGSGVSPVLAMHAQVGYPFYRGVWLGGEPMCPATLPHVQMAFETGGYRSTQESICMTAEMPAKPEERRAAADLEFEDRPLEMKHEPMRESWIGFEPQSTVAFLHGEQVGSIGWVLLPYLDRLGASCMNIYGLGVHEAQRRQGIASALINRAMRLAHAQGARFCSVGTQLWNAPAHATYGKLGYRPHCMVVGRTFQIAQNRA